MYSSLPDYISNLQYSQRYQSTPYEYCAGRLNEDATVNSQNMANMYAIDEQDQDQLYEEDANGCLVRKDTSKKEVVVGQGDAFSGTIKNIYGQNAQTNNALLFSPSYTMMAGNNPMLSNNSINPLLTTNTNTNPLLSNMMILPSMSNNNNNNTFLNNTNPLINPNLNPLIDLIPNSSNNPFPLAAFSTFPPPSPISPLNPFNAFQSFSMYSFGTLSNIAMPGTNNSGGNSISVNNGNNMGLSTSNPTPIFNQINSSNSIQNQPIADPHQDDISKVPINYRLITKCTIIEEGEEDQDQQDEEAQWGMDNNSWHNFNNDNNGFYGQNFSQTPNRAPNNIFAHTFNSFPSIFHSPINNDFLSPNYHQTNNNNSNNNSSTPNGKSNNNNNNNLSNLNNPSNLNNLNNLSNFNNLNNNQDLLSLPPIPLSPESPLPRLNNKNKSSFLFGQQIDPKDQFSMSNQINSNNAFNVNFSRLQQQNGHQPLNANFSPTLKTTLKQKNPLLLYKQLVSKLFDGTQKNTTRKRKYESIVRFRLKPIRSYKSEQYHRVVIGQVVQQLNRIKRALNNLEFLEDNTRQRRNDSMVTNQEKTQIDILLSQYLQKKNTASLQQTALKMFLMQLSALTVTATAGTFGIPMQSNVPLITPQVHLGKFLKNMRKTIYKMLDSCLASVLYLAPPPVYTLMPWVSPLTLVISHLFHTWPANTPIDNVVYVNLTGIDTPTNIALIRGIAKQQLTYVTVYDEIEFIKKQFSKQSNDFSKAMTEEIAGGVVKDSQFNLTNQRNNNQMNNNQKNDQTSLPKQSPKILAIPLYSSTVSQDSQGCFLTGTSQDIIFLFKAVLFDEIRRIRPRVIIMSIGGKYTLEEQHFSMIVRELAIIANHRVLLYPELELKTDVEMNTDGTKIDSQFRQLNLDHVNQLKMIWKERLRASGEEWQWNDLSSNIILFPRLTTGQHTMNRSSVVLNSSTTSQQGILRYIYMSKLAKYKAFQFLGSYIPADIDLDITRQILQEDQKNLIQLNARCIAWATEIVDRALDELHGILGRQTLQINCTMSPKIVISYRKCQSLCKKPQQFQEYLEMRKKHILAETILTPRFRKSYYFKKNQAAPNKSTIHCYEFSMKKPRQRIALEKFTQVIVLDQWARSAMILLINVRDYSDNGRLKFMYGLGMKKQCQFTFSEIPYYGRDTMKDENRSLGQNYIEHVNYSYCIYGQTVFLYWPLRWNLLEEAQNALLGLHYQPRAVHKLMRIGYTQSQDHRQISVFYQELYVTDSESCIPRWGSSARCVSSNTIYVFGGFYGTRQDWEEDCSGLTELTTKKDTFTCLDLQLSSKRVQLPLRAFYTLTDLNKDSIIISGGFTREALSGYSLIANDAYEFKIKWRELSAKAGSSTIISLPQPIATNKPGKFKTVVPFDRFHSQCRLEEREMSKSLKYKFIMSSTSASNNSTTTSKKEAISFVDPSYAQQFHNPTPHSFMMERERVCAFSAGGRSPELLVKGNRSALFYRLELQLEATKQFSSFLVSEFVFPNEGDIISEFWYDSSIFLIAKSINYTNGHTVLFERGPSEAKSGDTIEQRLLRCFQFKSGEYSLHQRSLFVSETHFFLVGGRLRENGHSAFREDYLLEKVMGRLVLRTLQVRGENVGTLLEMERPYVLQVRKSESYFLYAIDSLKWLFKTESFSTMKSSVRQLLTLSLNLIALLPDGKIQSLKLSASRLRVTGVYPFLRVGPELVESKITALRVSLIQLSKKTQLSPQEHSFLNYLNQSIKSLPESHSFQKKMLEFGTLCEVKLKEKGQKAQSIKNRLKLVWQAIGARTLYSIDEAALKSVNLAHMNSLRRIVVEDQTRKLVKYLGVGPNGYPPSYLFEARSLHPLLSPVSACYDCFDQIGLDQQLGISGAIMLPNSVDKTICEVIAVDNIAVKTKCSRYELRSQG